MFVCEGMWPQTSRLSQSDWHLLQSKLLLAGESSGGLYRFPVVVVIKEILGVKTFSRMDLCGAIAAC